MKNFLFLLLFPLIGFGQFNPIFFASGLNPNRNRLTKTEEFDNVIWTKSNTTITANTTTAPDGNTTADKLIATAITAGHGIFQPISGGNASMSFSVYAKAAEYNYILIGGMWAGNSHGCDYYFNLTDGTFNLGLNNGLATNITAKSTDVGNGWYRISLSFTNDSSMTRITICPSNNNTNTVNSASHQSTFLGNGTSGIYVWGAQAENGLNVTPYIKKN